jgi:hypothetical protein
MQTKVKRPQPQQKIICPSCEKRHIDQKPTTIGTLTHICSFCHHAWQPFPFRSIGADDKDILNNIWNDQSLQILPKCCEKPLAMVKRSLFKEIIICIVGTWVALSFVWFMRTIMLPGYIVATLMHRVWKRQNPKTEEQPKIQAPYLIPNNTKD